MDELLNQAYYDLIYTLITQKRSQVPAILQAQSHLVDHGFLTTLHQTAATLTERNCPEDANFLTTLAQQLEQSGGLRGYLAQFAPPPQSQTANPADNPTKTSKSQPVPNSANPEKKAEAERLFQQGLQQFQANQYTPAFQTWQQALLLYRELPDPQGEVHCLSRLGNLYQSLGQYEQAIPCHQQALVMARKAQYYRGETDALNNLGLICDATGQYGPAIAAYQQALKLAQEIQYRVAEANSLGNLGKIYLAQGHIKAAVQSYQQALAIAQDIQYRFGEINFRSNLGNLYTIAGYPDRAIEELTQGLTLAQAQNYSLWQVHFLQYLGQAHRAQGNFEEAIARLEQSLTLAQVQSAPLAEANILQDLARVAQQQGHLDSALNLYQRAQTLKQNLPDQTEVATLLNTIGQIYQTQGRQDLALETFRASLERATPQIQPWDYYLAGRSIGALGEATEQPELTLQGYGAAVQALSQIHPASLPPERRGEFQAELGGIFARLIQTQIQLQHPEQALETIEYWRAQQQLMAYGDQPLTSQDKTLQSQLTLYQRFQQQIQALTARRQSEVLQQLATVGIRFNSPITQQAETAMLNSLTTERQKTWEAIQAQDPVLASQLQPIPGDLSRIQAWISNPRTALLNFYSTPEQTFLLILSSKGLHLISCDADQTQSLQAWLQTHWLEPMVKAPLEWRDRLDQLLIDLAQLLKLDQLIAGFLRDIQDLIIVPDQNLSHVPFGALPVTDEDSFKYLGDRFALRILPSCQMAPLTPQPSAIPVESTVESPVESPVEPIIEPVGIIADGTGELVLSSYGSEKLAQSYPGIGSAYLQADQGTLEDYEALMQRVHTLYGNHPVEVNLEIPAESFIRLTNQTISLAQILTWRCPKLFRIVLPYCQSTFQALDSWKYPLSMVNALLQIGAQELVYPCGLLIMLPQPC
ncbi:MAG: tetratricopeptide repeat protein [Oscillatoriales cyanobacterium RM2_1_1]|nr:tetratricopeptide repeat protein [Oscillatoriales cyanobacterium RM2_1_1]